MYCLPHLAEYCETISVGSFCDLPGLYGPTIVKLTVSMWGTLVRQDGINPRERRESEWEIKYGAKRRTLS